MWRRLATAVGGARAFREQAQGRGKGGPDSWHDSRLGRRWGDNPKHEAGGRHRRRAGGGELSISTPGPQAQAEAD